jgi:hypothetical protein
LSSPNILDGPAGAAQRVTRAVKNAIADADRRAAVTARAVVACRDPSSVRRRPRQRVIDTAARMASPLAVMAAYEQLADQPSDRRADHDPRAHGQDVGQRRGQERLAEASTDVPRRADRFARGRSWRCATVQRPQQTEYQPECGAPAKQQFTYHGAQRPTMRMRLPHARISAVCGLLSSGSSAGWTRWRTRHCRTIPFGTGRLGTPQLPSALRRRVRGTRLTLYEGCST